MAVVAIFGAGMMGSALAFPARENGNEVRLVGTHLDREIISSSSSRLVIDSGIPVVGVNSGRVGFLSENRPEESYKGPCYG